MAAGIIKDVVYSRKIAPLLTDYDHQN